MKSRTANAELSARTRGWHGPRDRHAATCLWFALLSGRHGKSASFMQISGHTQTGSQGLGRYSARTNALPRVASKMEEAASGG